MKSKYSKNYQPNATQRQYQATEADVKLKRNRNKPEFMSKYNITYADIAEMFGYSSPNSFYNAHCRQDIMNGVEELVKRVENKLV